MEIPKDDIECAVVKEALADVKERMLATGWVHWSDKNIRRTVEKRKSFAMEKSIRTETPKKLSRFAIVVERLRYGDSCDGTGRVNNESASTNFLPGEPRDAI